MTTRFHQILVISGGYTIWNMKPLAPRSQVKQNRTEQKQGERDRKTRSKDPFQIPIMVPQTHPTLSPFVPRSCSPTFHETKVTGIGCVSYCVLPSSRSELGGPCSLRGICFADHRPTVGIMGRALIRGHGKYLLPASLGLFDVRGGNDDAI